MHYLVNRYIEKLGISFGKALSVLGNRISQAANKKLKAEIDQELLRLVSGFQGGLKGHRTPEMTRKLFRGTNWTHVVPSEKEFRRGIFNVLDDLKKAKNTNISEKKLYKMFSERMKNSPTATLVNEL